MSKIIRAGRIDDAEGVEISVVDRPSNGKSKIKSVSIAKRAAEMELNPEALKAMGATAEDIGPLRKLFGFLFSKKATDQIADPKDAVIVSLKAKFDLDIAKTASKHDLRKSLYDVGRLAEMVQSLDYMWQCTAAEREWEGDESPVPEKIAEVRDQLGRILLEMAEEELNELKPAKGAE
jgi:hypothetical protein